MFVMKEDSHCIMQSALKKDIRRKNLCLYSLQDQRAIMCDDIRQTKELNL